MKLFLVATLISTLSMTSFAQKAELPKHHEKPTTSFIKHSYLFSIGIGLADHYRLSYPVPDSFVKNRTLGMSPLYFRLEYAITNNIGIVAGFGYDQFIFSYQRDIKYSYRGNTPIPFHNYSDKMMLLGITCSANYHFTKLFKSTKLDPYAGLGISLTRKEDNYYGDKRNTTTDNIGMIAHLGIRYYVDKKIGFNFQVGYDGISVANLGFSYRLL